VVDADGHVLEPADTWLKYLDPQYRDRAIRIARDERDYEVLLIDGQPLKTLRGELGALGGIGMDTSKLLSRGQVTYAEGCPPGSYDPVERLRVMDGEGIDQVLLYPTIGICWEGHVTDGRLATAYTRAYNRWLAEFCRTAPRRLYPVAHISLLDPEGAVEETIRARKEGCVGIFLSPDLAARGGRHFDDPAFARFWETAQELAMPIAFHVIVRDRQWFRQWLRKDPSDALFGIAFLATDVMAAFTQMLASGMFEKYPRLKCAVLEAGSNWIAAWLDRLDHKYRVMAHQTPITMEPSRYFYRQCLISADPDESVTAQMVEHLGADYFIWASDYPHIDASMGVVRELQERLAPLPEDARRKVLGQNAQRFYGLAG
jgi:predicted TIM-barrel fold metal-dependent hydrolase